mmetsp:Transcript_85141/g.237621  ORF Transcript_85141/g.237621 Transcript_85141/m.237621 type:complete len:409 (+) Transcript_85141:663-1889(+)
MFPEEVFQGALLIRVVLDDVDELLDVLIGSERVPHPDADLHRPSKDPRRQIPHFFVECRREHHRLPLGRFHVGGDLPNLRAEALAKHMVGFIQDEEAHRADAEPMLLVVDEVVEPAHRAHHALRMLTEAPELRLSHPSPAIASERRNAGDGRKFLGLCLDLHHKLAGRSQHEDLGGVCAWATSLLQHLHWQVRVAFGLRAHALADELCEARQQKRQRLPRACLGHADEVAARGKDGPRVGLDGRRRLEARGPHDVHDARAKPRLRALEGGPWLWCSSACLVVDLDAVGRHLASHFVGRLFHNGAASRKRSQLASVVGSDGGVLFLQGSERRLQRILRGLPFLGLVLPCLIARALQGLKVELELEALGIWPVPVVNSGRGRRWRYAVAAASASDVAAIVDIVALFVFVV